MTQRTWVIIGATSIIAEEFAHLAARAGHRLRLVGRYKNQLEVIATNIQLRYKIHCDFLIMDMREQPDTLFSLLNHEDSELDLFIGHSDFSGNSHLNAKSITQLIDVNILSTSLIVNAYLNMNQSQHNLLYLSSVAACRGRAKNSLYGASKAAIEIYLQGLQQGASENQHITIARLGFIDTKQTFGLPGIFYAAQPSDCANACWNAVKRKKRMFYYPSFWRAIMGIINHLPFFIYKK